MENEEWRPVFGFEVTYEVSNLGRVRSLPRSRDRLYLMRDGAGRPIRRSIRVPTQGKVLKPKRTAGGYEEVCLRVAGRQRMALVHRLVLEAFVGPCGSTKIHAAHLNGQRADNRLENLTWATAFENASHRKFANYTSFRSPFSRRFSQKKLTAAQALHGSGWPVEDIAEVLSLSPRLLAKRITQAASADVVTPA
jgi:hypothetical protein